ncbi:MAG: pyridoxal phosphate-dependent aminotransferase [Gammaproteobacteria bacterium]|nr:pyridoxal phosphate-dependent aminotransferase [Gammaproteobacteria bacterium]
MKEYQNRTVLLFANPIRAIGELADELEKKHQIPVIRLHLGNPGTDKEEDVVQAEINSIQTRQAGYAPHSGDDADRQALADFLTAVENVAETPFSMSDVALSPGATAITACLFVARLIQAGDIILLSNPGYPTYVRQVTLLGGEVVEYDMDEEGLPRYDNLCELITTHEKNGKKVRVLVLTYPHNPTGKALSVNTAKKLADMINELTKAYPDIVFYNDAVYNATVSAELGYHGFYQYLSPLAKASTVTGISGAKMTAQGGERIGGAGSINPSIMRGTFSALSFLMAGSNVHSSKGLITAMTLLKDHFRPAVANENPRHKIAEFYGSRRKLVADTLTEINNKLNGGRIQGEDTGASMYVWATFSDALSGKPVPLAVRDLVGHDTIQTGNHFMKFLLSLHRLGFTPISVCDGEVFGAKSEAISVRISCVDRKMSNMIQAMNSLKGGIGILTGIDMGAKEDLKSY